MGEDYHCHDSDLHKAVVERLTPKLDLEALDPFDEGIDAGEFISILSAQRLGGLMDSEIFLELGKVKA